MPACMSGNLTRSMDVIRVESTSSIHSSDTNGVALISAPISKYLPRTLLPLFREPAPGKAPGNVSIHSDLTGQAQHSLGNDVALDLIGATSD